MFIRVTGYTGGKPTPKTTDKRIMKSWARDLLINLATNHIDRFLASVTPWELDQLKIAFEKGLLREESGFLLLPDGRRWSLMTVNKEYITHIAIYSELVGSGQWHPENIKLEYEYLDLVIFEQGSPVIAVEVKRSEAEAAKLVKGLAAVDPLNLPELDRGNDPIRKMKSLLKLKPKEFWVVSPEQRWKFELSFTNGALELIPLGNVEAA